MLLAIFLSALDQTIVSVSLHAVALEFGREDLITSVTSAYLISAVVAMPLYGRLDDIYGRRLLLRAALAVFAIDLVGCAQSGKQRSEC